MNNNYTTSYSTNSLDYILIWAITLCSLKLFTLFITLTVVKAVILTGVALVIGFLIVHLVYGKGMTIRKHFNTEIILIFVALLISAFASQLMHNQHLQDALFYQYEFYLFLFYFLLHKLRPDPDQLLKMFLWLAYIYAIIYFLQYLLYPTQILSAKTMEDRGTIRIMLPGTDYMIATWFILLSRFFMTKKTINIILLIPFVIILILLGTRQLIAATALLTLLNILLSRTIKSRLLVFLIVVIAIIPFYFLFQGVFDQMLAVSHKGGSSSLQNNIRFMAAHYFLFDLNQNPIWMLTGNGMPAPHSDYGRFLFGIAEQLGFYQSDVGIIGDFSKFGILFVVAEIAFLVKIVLCRCRERFAFIRYVALMTIMTMFTGAGLYASTIVKICFMLYIVDVEKNLAENPT